MGLCVMISASTSISTPKWTSLPPAAADPATVIDPTGAGDSFAGGIMGYLASDDTPPPGRLRRAMAYGSVVASFAVEGFGLDRLHSVTRDDIDQRLETYRGMLAF